MNMPAMDPKMAALKPAPLRIAWEIMITNMKNASSGSFGAPVAECLTYFADLAGGGMPPSSAAVGRVERPRMDGVFAAWDAGVAPLAGS